uniref:ATP-dependent Clp protease ATP-binding subunit ClpA homolog n=1 Tax=Choreocolax polysiphoniae TaxID=282351 RepID=A0A0B5W2H3_9FLOR|nr:ATP-dependent Clp protease [Choreocolax polysiphoniae]AJH65844.1 ATP-dependent Clp protease [Choreocolax polysiphoniae]
MFERFTEKAIKVIMLAQEEARRLGHNFVGTEQILLGLIGEGTGIASQILKSMNITLKDARIEVERRIGHGSGFVAIEIPFTPRAKHVLELSLEEARQLGHNYISTEHLLMGLIREGEGVAVKVLQDFTIDISLIRAEIIQMLGEESDINTDINNNIQVKSKTPTLEEFGANLTELAIKDILDPVVGRQKEIERVIQILGRRTKNNPILIGEPGVGKTAIAEGLAQKIINKDIPSILEDKLVIALDVGLLVAGTKYRGEFEERLKRIMDEIKNTNNIILVIDEVHTLIGAGAAEGAIDAANLLKPALARGELQCIGATTIEEYRKHIEKDAALERRFQPVMVKEPTVEETIEILFGLRDRYEKHHQLTMSDEVLTIAAKYANQYISDRFLPDKAIDLIDEAGSRVRLLNSQLPLAARELDKELNSILKLKNKAIYTQKYEKAEQYRIQEIEIKAQITAITQNKKNNINLKIKDPIVTEEDIAEIVSFWTGIPVMKLTKNESEKLINMEDILHSRIIGQEEAVTAVSKAVRRARVGLKNPNRPIASFIFSGPTGVGKTELTKALASYFFCEEEAMIRLDMSEYMERHTVSKLIGSPPGYVGYSEGGYLTEAVRKKPYTVILFDEIEKAHPDIFNLLLQILEDGRLTDAKGKTINFKNTLLIMTSNIGSKIIEKGGGSLGFELDESSQIESQYNHINSLVNEELKQYFRPEFLNRLDEIIIFKKLSIKEIKKIADLMLKEVFKKIKKQNITLSVTERFKTKLINEGYDPSYGARPLRRAVMRLLEDNLAEEILNSRIQSGDSAIVDISKDGLVNILLKDKLEI